MGCGMRMVCVKSRFRGALGLGLERTGDPQSPLRPNDPALKSFCSLPLIQQQTLRIKSVDLEAGATASFAAGRKYRWRTEWGAPKFQCL
jgi:hypothetical protein